ncbi:MAG: thioesterase family protein [Pseudomonadales bacterium]
MSKTSNSPPPERDALAADLLKLLELERIEENLYLGQNEQRSPTRLFGGQVLSQALMAASRTVEGGLAAHSLHAYFLTPGQIHRPVLYEVERIRDGRSFTTRRVVAVQEGRAIFSMDVSFQIQEIGFEHAHAMPNVPLPDELEDDLQVALAMGDDPRLGLLAKHARPFEIRSVFKLGSQPWSEDRTHNPSWIRFPSKVDDPVLARALLAYASDMGLVSTAALPHQSEVPRKQIQTASLDHALWIHREVVMGEWLLLHRRTTMAEGARGLIHADFYSESGALVASVTQEGLLRVLDQPAS